MNCLKHYLNSLQILVLFALFFAVIGRGEAQEIVATAAKAGGVYAVGEKIVWRVALKGEGAVNIKKVSYLMYKDVLVEAGRGELTLGPDGAELETQLDEPGTLFVEFKAQIAPDKSVTKRVGAVANPVGIAPSAPAPDDFDVFWKAKLAELSVVAPNPRLEVVNSGNAEVDYWKITMDNIRGTQIRGQLSRPKTAAKKLPAKLVLQWAGIYALPQAWMLAPEHEGWLTLNINAHDLPIDESPEFYQDQAANALKDYASRGNADREQSYFLRMYLACYRAVEYLASRDDWDGKTLVVIGASQGGMQAIVAAGLNPKVTAVIANVPAGCDQTGPLAGRRPGWPQWFGNDKNADPKIIETSRYYDTVNFARRIKCPSLLAAGLIDIVCPAPGIIAAYNQIEAPKELLIMENSDHEGKNYAQHSFYQTSAQWIKQLKVGQLLLEGKG